MNPEENKAKCMAEGQKQLEEQKKPVLLWKPFALEESEPEAVLTYNGQSYALCYTLIDSLMGWISIGSRGSLIGIDGGTNLNLALDHILTEMRRKHYPISKEELDAYAAHGINTAERKLEEVRDYRNDKPLTPAEVADTANLRWRL